jgi:DNA topoisomerase-3
MGFESGCKFRVGVSICARDIPIAEVRRMLATGRTELIDGFISRKSGKRFSARLVVSDGEAVFNFDK